MRTKFAAIVVVSLLTLSAIAVGASALGPERDATDASSNTISMDSGQVSGDSAAVSTFKFVCPFH
jgi:hypothetical protein